jgi:hypothetical protein
VTLEHLREGMKVVDVDGETIGTIGLIHFGDPAAEQLAIEPPDIAGAVITTELVRSEPKVPEPLRGNMLQLGFVRVDLKIHLRRDHHYYVVPNQIVAIDGETVSLANPKNELIQPS